VAEAERFWSIQLWLGDHLVEEHIAPAMLAEQYANVIRLRVQGLPGRRLRCEPLADQLPSPAPTVDLRTAAVDTHWHIARNGL
jgi:hypothetical protein